MNEIAPLTERQLSTLKNTIAKDCDPQEFNLFVEYCKRIGLDPIRKQVIPLVFNKADPKKRQLTIVVTIDGLRNIAERVGNYRPDEDEPRFVYSNELKNEQTNPLGIEKCIVVTWKQDRKGDWYKVNGTAYWDEYVPIRRWDGNAQIDSKTMWPRMPRQMLAKCAEAQALRKGWPDHFAGVHVDAEFDRANLEDRDASEIVENYTEQLRLGKIGGERAIMFWLDPSTGMERIPVGQIADRFIERAKQCEDINELANLRSVNVDPLREFWAIASNDALELKKELEQIEDELRAADDATPEVVRAC